MADLPNTDRYASLQEAFPEPAGRARLLRAPLRVVQEWDSGRPTRFHLPPRRLRRITQALDRLKRESQPAEKLLQESPSGKLCVDDVIRKVPDAVSG